METEEDIEKMIKEGLEIRKELFKELSKKFSETVLAIELDSGCSGIFGPYKVEKELGDYYIYNNNIGDDWYLSVNSKGLIALHDKDGKEFYHVEKDFMADEEDSFRELTMVLMSDVDELHI